MARKTQQLLSAVSAPLAEKTVSAAQRSAGFGRRAFVLGVTTGVLCGVGTVLAPRAIPALEAQTQAWARAAVLDEIGELEGASLEAAVRAAELTRQAVTMLVLPLARFATRIGDGALDLLLTSIDAARAALSILHLSTTLFDAFRDVVVSWRAGISALPIMLDALLTADIASAEVYLRALKRLADQPTLR